MTEQYAQPNINNPRLTRSFVATAAPLNVQLNFDDQLVVADTTLGVIGFTLPLASQFPTWEVVFKADNAGSSGNSVLVAAQAGETIDGAASILLTTDQESLFLKSDGSNWRIVGGTAAAAASISLDLTYDSTAAASVPPVLFVTWPEITAAVAAIPGNPLAIYSKTKYRLNVEDATTVPAGSYDMTNAEMRSAVKRAPDGTGVSILGPGDFTFENVARMNGWSILGFSTGPAFIWTVFDFVEIVDCVVTQVVGEFGVPPIFFVNDDAVMRLYGSNSFGPGAVLVGVAPGSLLTIDAFDHVSITGDALTGPGDVDLNIFGGGTDISLAQGDLAGTLNVNIGGGQTGSGQVYSNGETILFSSGAVTFNTPAEQEIFAGGTNPPGAVPQIPAIAAPFRGYTAAKNGYLRGISVRIPTVFAAPANGIIVRVYVAGVPVMTETFTTATVSQFLSTTFAQYSEGDSIQVTIATTGVTDPVATLDDGIIVTLRSS